jgi:hypothetical protein
MAMPAVIFVLKRKEQEVSTTHLQDRKMSVVQHGRKPGRLILSAQNKSWSFMRKGVFSRTHHPGYSKHSLIFRKKQTNVYFG